MPPKTPGILGVSVNAEWKQPTPQTLPPRVWNHTRETCKVLLNRASRDPRLIRPRFPPVQVTRGAEAGKGETVQKTARVDPEDLHVGAVLRHAERVLQELPVLQYDPKRKGRLNDIVFGEILEPIPRHSTVGELSMLELIPPEPGVADVLELQYHAPARPGLCLGALGNRYATPILLGGLQHPVTGAGNGEVQGGTVLDSLFGINCLGFVNAGIPPEERVKVRIHGVLVDRDGRSANLRDFRRCLVGIKRPGGGRTPQVVVGGYATDAGKTTCARALVQGLRGMGFRVTMEKKTGTACCKDWLSCLLDRDLDPRSAGASTSFSVRLPTTPTLGFDFVEVLGIVSDVSLPTRTFVEEATAFSATYLARRPADVHVVELADGLAHSRNRALLAHRSFRELVDLLIYNPLPYPDAVGHFLAFLEQLAWPAGKPVLLSGPLANDPQYDMVVEEVVHRYKAKVIPCARWTGQSWRSWTEPLSRAVADLLGLAAADAPESDLIREQRS